MGKKKSVSPHIARLSAVTASLVCASLLLAGCGAGQSEAAQSPVSAMGEVSAVSTSLPEGDVITVNSEVLDSAKNGSSEQVSDNAEIANGEEVSESGESVEVAEKSIDVDLTSLSSTMVFAEAMNMTQDPFSYMGKTIKMRGTYSPEYYAQTDGYYHYVVVADAAACCANGFEFIWSGDHDYPGDYPEINSEIEVTGVFGQYEEMGYTYSYLEVGENDVVVL